MQQRSRSNLILWFLCVVLALFCVLAVAQLRQTQHQILSLQNDLMQCTVTQSEWDTLSTNHEVLQEEYSTLKGEYSMLQGNLAESLQTTQTLTKELSASSEKIQTLDQSLVKSEEKLAGYKEQYANLEQYVVSLEGILESYAADPGAEERLDVIADLQTQLAQSETDAGTLRSRVAELEEKLTEAEQAYAGAFALMQESGQSAETAVVEMELMQNECARLQDELAHSLEKLEQTHAQLTQSQNDLNARETELLQAQNTCAALSEQISSNEAAMAQYETEAKSLRQEISRLQTSLTEIEQYASGRDALLIEAQTSITSLSEENQALRVQLDMLPSPFQTESTIQEVSGILLEDDDIRIRIARLEAQLNRIPLTSQQMTIKLQEKRLLAAEHWKENMISFLKEVRKNYQIEPLMPYPDPQTGEMVDPLLDVPTIS